MNLLKQFVDVFLHIDKHLVGIVNDYQGYTYVIMFLVIFAETGLVIAPFLPGDSLLFAIGALIAHGNTGLNIHLMALLLFIAGVIGNSVNYYIGRRVGVSVFNGKNRFLKQQHYEQAHAFFEKHGAMAIIFSRFMPILRTIAPFVAGASKMPLRKFTVNNFIGAFAWVYLFVYGGYALGGIPFFKERFSLIIVIIIVLTLAPAVIAGLRSWLRSRKK